MANNDNDNELLSRLWQTTTFRRRNTKGSSYEDTHDCLMMFERGTGVDPSNPLPALFLEHPALARVVHLLLSDRGKIYFHLVHLENIIIMLPSDKYIRICGSASEKDALTAYIMVHAVFRYPSADVKDLTTTDGYTLWKSQASIDCWMDALKGSNIVQRFSFSTENVLNLNFVCHCILSDMNLVSHDVSRGLHSLLSNEQSWKTLSSQMVSASAVHMIVFRIADNTYFTLQLDTSECSGQSLSWFVDLYDTRVSEFVDFYPGTTDCTPDPIVSSRNLAPLALGVGVGVAASGIGYWVVRKILE